MTGITVGRHRVARLMGENALKARQRRRFKRTTDSLHASSGRTKPLKSRLQRSGAEPEMGCRHLLHVWTREGLASPLPSSLTFFAPARRRLGRRRPAP